MTVACNALALALNDLVVKCAIMAHPDHDRCKHPL